MWNCVRFSKSKNNVISILSQDMTIKTKIYSLQQMFISVEMTTSTLLNSFNSNTTQLSITQSSFELQIKFFCLQPLRKKWNCDDQIQCHFH